MKKILWDRLQVEISSLSYGALALLLLLASPLLLIGGVGVLGYQAYHFLRSGDWLPMSSIDGLSRLGSRWANEPDTWLGIWKILDVLPLTLALICLGLACWLGFIKVSLAAWNANDRLKAIKKPPPH